MCRRKYRKITFANSVRIYPVRIYPLKITINRIELLSAAVFANVCAFFEVYFVHGIWELGLCHAVSRLSESDTLPLALYWFFTILPYSWLFPVFGIVFACILLTFREISLTCFINYMGIMFTLGVLWACVSVVSYYAAHLWFFPQAAFCC